MGGGLLGGLLHKVISTLLANIGAYIVSVMMIFSGGLMMSRWTIYDLANAFITLWGKLQAWLDKNEKKREAKEAEKNQQEEKKKENAKEDALDDEALAQIPIIFEKVEQITPKTAPEQSDSRTENLNKPQGSQSFEEKSDDEKAIQSNLKSRLQYRLPNMSLLAPIKSKDQRGEKKIVHGSIRKLETAFESFGIKATVERAEIGPSVTKYEIKPATGVRVSRIANLSDDLALALAAKDVRIEAPIPGKSLIGIEVPNSEIATVGFRELWEQSQTNADNLLEIPLGKAVNGSVKTFDLTRMPHILVAGSTGSGKSVAVNGIIASILMKASPDQVKFMMIDPKMVELSVYNDIPHLLIPVVTNPRKASRALQKVVDEMEKRYELFSRFGVRHIAGYNAKVSEWNKDSEEKQVPLPLIVVIVDELADLMMVASKEVEESIIRIGQKARAAGIHMILATQRPSVNVISGLIKANVPSRIAFAVSSGTDSRTILDENGAEKLLGRGDMLFKPIDENHPIRLQGSFISDDDVERIVTFIKDQAEADYDESFEPGDISESDLENDATNNAADPLFEQAKSLVIETQKASASMLQRRLSVGFNRATRLIEELEAAGIIGPAEGTKPRKVLEGQQL